MTESALVPRRTVGTQFAPYILRMTAPRQIVPGRYWMVTRRCTQRQFLLRPCAQTNAYFEYCLSIAAKQSGVRVIAYLVMSNHYHAVVFDPLGRLPVFLECLNKLVARALNAHWGRWENFWSTESACATHLLSAEDVLDKILYILTNPVVDDLVDRVIDWPGASSLSSMLSELPLLTKRPRGFFRENGPTPPEVTLDLMRPPGFEGATLQEWSSLLLARITKTEHISRVARHASGKRLLGRKAILRVSAFDSPKTLTKRRNLRPAVACKCPKDRTRALVALRAFRAAYAKARVRLAQGILDVVFPLGTYRMRLLGMICVSST